MQGERREGEGREEEEKEEEKKIKIFSVYQNIWGPGMLREKGERGEVGKRE